ncbi:hypothetical protein QZH41_015697, partial [Actinostola sp. cb2023]
NYPEEVKEIKQSLYVDDLITGGTTVSQVYQLKETAKTIFQQAQFELHKWHSHIPELENTGPPVDTDQSYAKEHLGVKKGETKLLGLPRDKEKDTIQVNFQTPLTAITKREILGNLAKIYDPLGLASPVTVAAKMLYRDACDSGATWDKELPTEQQRNWKSWEQHTPEKIEIPRSLVEFQKEIESIELHAFGDASGKGVSSTVYAIVHQPSGDSQGLVARQVEISEESPTQLGEKTVQTKGEYASKFQEDKLQLNLQKNNEGVYECRGRIQGDYPIYLPDGDIFTEKLVAHAHLQTLHGGVGLTMSHVRAKYWIPRLRRMARRIIRNCHGCKRFQAIALSSPPTGNLPTDRTGGSTPFQVVGVDYAGPIIYKLKNGKEGKAYILLYACSLTRALHLDLVPDQTTEEFIRRFKCFIARRGKPQKIYSDNGRTFVAAAKWLKKLRNDESFNNWLANEGIRWQFNLSRAPWWGGQFERMVGLTKQALYKSIGKGNLRWSELEEVLLDIEVALNNRPLSYVEDDVQMPLLTPSAMLFGQPSQLPEQEPDTIEEIDLRKRARYLRKCKDALWTRWQTEYLKALRERHNMKNNARETTLKPGDVMIIKSDERNSRKWSTFESWQVLPGATDSTSVPARGGLRQHREE